MGRSKTAQALRFRGGRSALPGLPGILAAVVTVLLASSSSRADSDEPTLEDGWVVMTGSWGEPAKEIPSPPPPSPPGRPEIKARSGGHSYLFFSPKKRASTGHSHQGTPKPDNPEVGTNDPDSARKAASKPSRSLSYLFFQPQTKNGQVGRSAPKPIPSAAQPKSKIPVTVLGRGSSRPIPRYQPYLFFQPKNKTLSSSTPADKKTTTQ